MLEAGLSNGICNLPAELCAIRQRADHRAGGAPNSHVLAKATGILFPHYILSYKNCISCSMNKIVCCSAAIADAIAKSIPPEELPFVAALLTAVADQLALIAVCQE